MAEIVVSGIEKSFEQDRVVLDDVSFQVEAGERVGLLGPNGAGKTTLLRIMTGELTPDKGFIAIPQGRRIGYISQLAEVPEGALVEDVLRMAFAEVNRVSRELEEVRQRMDAGEHSDSLLRRYDTLTTRFDMLGGYDCETRLSKVANGLHISPEQRRQPFASLSGGEQTRIRLAVMILRETMMQGTGTRRKLLRESMLLRGTVRNGKKVGRRPTCQRQSRKRRSRSGPTAGSASFSPCRLTTR